MDGFDELWGESSDETSDVKAEEVVRSWSGGAGALESIKGEEEDGQL